MEDEIRIESLQSLTMAQQPNVSMADLQGWKNCDFTDDYVWIFVEGVDDRKIYDQLFNDNVLVWESVDDNNLCGCANMESIVKYATSLDMTNVAGIRDKDYTPYLPAYQLPQNVFMTDTHSIETMMLEDEDVQSGLEATKRGFRKSLRKAYDALKGVGYLRAYGISIGSTFSFDGYMTCRNIWLQNDKKFVAGWRKELHNKFFSMPAANGTPCRQSFVTFIRQNNLHLQSPADICQGHDLVHLLQWMGAVNNPYVKFKTYYTLSSFSKTNLYSSLDNWAHQNGNEIFH